MNDQELVREAISHFKTAMDTRSKMTVRIGRRVTFIIRTSAIAFTLVACIMLFLVTMLSIKTQGIIEAIVTMNQHFDRMTDDMVVMRQKVARMETHIQSIPTITTETATINTHMTGIQQKTQRMSINIVEMEKGVHRMGQDTTRIRQSFQDMDYQMGAMEYEMDQISRPVRKFNDFLPFVK